MEITWLKSIVDAWQGSVAQGRPPHALMLSGPEGTGKRSAAAWLARSRLNMALPDLPEHPLAIPEHADLRWLAPPEDKHTIGIDQVRELVSELTLTSYEGGGKVAVIEPADAMTHNAANSLLKTLEEPPGDALLILVVERPGRLPATIFSRCQRLMVRPPAEADGLSWLQTLRPGIAWAPVLRDAGFAPLAALAAFDRLDETTSMAEEFAAVAAGSAAPLAVAARWARHEPAFVLDWLSRQVQMCISRTSGGVATGVPAVVSDSVLERIDRQKLFCYLDIINRLRGQPAGSFNVQLTFECLLIDWSERLDTVLAST
jgi:DNA polymerase-3 subunit delta'